MTNKDLAKALESIAHKSGFNALALSEAKELPEITIPDKAILDDWLTGKDENNPLHYQIRLKEIAQKIAKQSNRNRRIDT